MFNKTIVQQTKTEYVPYEKTITEIKAPTDDSIKLLNEFKQKALEDTMLLVEVKNTQFDFVVRYGEHPAEMTQYAVIKFTLNGQEIVKDLKLKPDAFFRSKNDLIDFFIKEYKRLIVELMHESFTKVTIKELINKGVE